MTLAFYEEYFRGRYVDMNDYDGRPVEAFLLQLVRKTKHLPTVHCRFRTQAHFTGSGGHSLGNGPAFFYSTNNDTAIMRFKRGLRQLFRWTMPWWWV